MISPRLNLRQPRHLEPITSDEFVSRASAEGRLLASAELVGYNSEMRVLWNAQWRMSLLSMRIWEA